MRSKAVQYPYANDLPFAYCEATSTDGNNQCTGVAGEGCEGLCPPCYAVWEALDHGPKTPTMGVNRRYRKSETVQQGQ